MRYVGMCGKLGFARAIARSLSALTILLFSLVLVSCFGEDEPDDTPRLTRTYPKESSGYESNVTFTASNLPSDRGAILHVYGAKSCMYYLGSVETGGATNFSLPIEFVAAGTATLSVSTEDGEGWPSDCSNSASYTYLGPGGGGGGGGSPPAAPESFVLQSPSSSPAYHTTPQFRFSNLNTSDTSSVRLYTDSECSAQIGSASVYSSTVYVTVSSPLSVGTHQVYARAIGGGGQSPCSSHSVSYTVLELPVPTTLSLVTPASSPGTHPRPTIQVGGIGAGMTVWLYSDSACSTALQSKTAFSESENFYLNTALPVGTHTFYARTSNSGGSSACSTASVSYTLEESPAPSIALSYPAASTHHSTMAELEVGVLSSHAGVALYSDGACTSQVATGSGSGTVKVKIHELTSGVHTLWAKVTGGTSLSPSSCSSSSVTYTVSPRVSFAAPAALLTSNAPGVPAIADIDGDLIPDLVVPTKSGTTSLPMYFYAGNGDGTFKSPVSLGNFVSAEGVAAGDFDGDGKLDLAVIEYYEKTMKVMLGNGDGTFASAVAYPSGRASEYPRSVAIGDLNGDGNPDVVVAHSGSTGSVAVFIGKGDGTFEEQVTYDASWSAREIFITDMDGDAKPDVVVGNYNSSSVSVFLGNGDGTLNAASHQVLDHATGGTAIGDLNGDGYPDVAQCAANTSNDVTVGLNDQAGALATPVSYASYSGSFMAAAAMGDVDGDGNLDVIVGHSGYSKVSISYGNGVGGIEPAEYFGVTGSANSIRAVDLNGDGDLDLIVGISAGSSSSINVLINQTP